MNIFFPIFSSPVLSIIITLMLIIIFSLFVILKKNQTAEILKKNITYLNETLQELDYQAKLIVKSDIELKLYQEEVEDKLTKLSLLKNLLSSSIHILDPEALFSLINEKIINDLGFKKGLILEFKNLEIIRNIGFPLNEIEIIKPFLIAKKKAFLNQPLLSEGSEVCKELILALHTKDILIAPIKARENIYHIFILSSFLTRAAVKKAEKEIFSIICMYLGQCLDNIQLFEDLYHTKDMLEKRIKERTNDLVKSLRKIESISKTKSDFISSVSHELRTPLTSIKGFSSLLVEEKFGVLPPEAKKRLEKIDENVDKLMSMINTLLDIARIESGKMDLNIAPAEIIKLIKEVTEFLLPQIENKKLTLTLELPNTAVVYMDRHLIERVLINLINNAIKFTPENGRLTVKCAREKDFSVISVADTGCGMEKEDQEKIFQEFYRVNNEINQKVKGTGLGLSLVKKIIDTHKEKIWVESKIGNGTTFFFTLSTGKKSTDER